ncbi:MAG: hypothetical protein KJP00_16395 [Bacteroidia bacterium]|nr:hypothetical protein [Bacteroidia bacterium]
MKITGTIEYQNIGPGCWGIIGRNGKKYRPVNFPEQLKVPGKKVTVVAREVDDISIFQWGIPVRISSFHT